MTPTLKAARERVEEAVSTLERMGKTGFPAVDDLRTLLAAPDEQEWRPIETAPRDGSDILLLANGMSIEARYCPGEWFEDTPISPREYDGGVWCAFDDALQFDIEETPGGDFHGQVTHWRPLPAPPVEKDT